MRLRGTCVVERLREADLGVNLALLLIFCCLATAALGAFGGIGAGARRAQPPQAPPPHAVVDLEGANICAGHPVPRCAGRSIPIA